MSTSAEHDELEPESYSMRLSRLTVDKLGVKLYDRASAVVAELVANGYDADAEEVVVSLPLGVELASKSESGEIVDKGFQIVVSDNGHGMTPREAQDYFLVVGADRRRRTRENGAKSRHKRRPVMGRKGIGKLAPFGICRQIEIKSAGGNLTENGYRVSHFILDFDRIVQDDDRAVPIDAGPENKTWSESRGTTVTLSSFLAKRVPNRLIFSRQLARRFALTKPDFVIRLLDAGSGEQTDIPQFQIELNNDTRVDIAARPVPFGETFLPVTGWLAFAKTAYKDEEEAGVRIYARGKIVATTRDFEQPAGFTGEFTARSYLVGEVHAEWLDRDNSDDLVRTDRQGILWDSDHGEALRAWGARLIKEIAAASAGPRRKAKSQTFIERSELEDRARERYGDDNAVVDAVMSLGKQIGAFASEDELEDEDYVSDLAEVVLSVGPHQALIAAFKQISGQADKSIEDLLSLFGTTRIAEMASYAQIASERVSSIEELRKVIDDPQVVEQNLQDLIARAPWLIHPDWSVITDNRSLKTFRDRFVKFWSDHYPNEISVAISYETKRPDFTLIHLGQSLYIVELKKPGHAFGTDDYGRLENYLEAFEQFFEEHKDVVSAFTSGWSIQLIADSVDIKNQTANRAFRSAEREGRVVRKTWNDFLWHASQAHEQFLDARESFARLADN